MAHDVFLSHASPDRAAALAVLEGLERAGIRCWIAPRDVQPGTEYGQQIVGAVKSCRVFLVVFSEHANSSPHVRREVERAVSLDRSIFPFRAAAARTRRRVPRRRCGRRSWCCRSTK